MLARKSAAHPITRTRPGGIGSASRGLQGRRKEVLDISQGKACLAAQECPGDRNDNTDHEAEYPATADDEDITTILRVVVSPDNPNHALRLLKMAVSSSAPNRSSSSRGLSSARSTGLATGA